MIELTKRDVVEILENFGVWLTFEGTFGEGITDRTHLKVKWAILDMLYESQHFDEHDLFFNVYEDYGLRVALEITLNSFENSYTSKDHRLY